MPDRTITVRPVEGGWCVECSVTGELMFLSGARAEENAANLASCLSTLGSDVRVAVYDRQNQLVAPRRFFSTEAAEAAS